MGNLDQILEKISTFNVNANTNIDIQAIVEKYVLFDMLKVLGIGLIIGIVALTIAIMVYKSVKRITNEQKIEKLEKFLNDFDSWGNIERLNNRLVEILEYMPRNKTKRKIRD